MHKFLILFALATCSLAINAQDAKKVENTITFQAAKKDQATKSTEPAKATKTTKATEPEKSVKTPKAAKKAKSKKAPAKYAFAGGVINIPKGFEGPELGTGDDGAKTIEFNLPHKGSDETTLMKIKVYNPGEKMPKITKDQLKEATKYYLNRHFVEIPRTTQKLRVNEMEFIEASGLSSGLPMARLKWIGERQSSKLHGAMYCYIYNSQIILFQAQDLESREGVHISKVMGAFEDVSLVNNPNSG